MVKPILIILLSVLFFFAPSAQAITKRADKECLLCHVLWFDVFETDQKTLIEIGDSSIVIAGSRGLASSRQMCDTCHDGYVVDSRVKVIQGNPHHVVKKPPDGITLPEIFRLDRNNEMYCGTCHTLHDIGGSATVGSTPFMRMDNERSQMCIACHLKKTEKQGYTNHPVLKKANNIPLLEAEQKGSEFSPDQEIICQSCHNVHGKRAMVMPMKNSTLCLICHKNKKSVISGKHDLRLTLSDEKNIRQQRPSESGPCGACHIPHNAAGKKLWARRSNPGNPASQMCLTCHDEQIGVVTKRIGKNSHPTNVKPVSKGVILDELPLFLTEATRDPVGSVQCFTCHNVHQWDPNRPTKKGGKDIEGDATNSFLRISNDQSSALCIKCHADKKEVMHSDHNLKVTAPEEKNVQGFTAGISGPCGACHVPHNATGKKLWARRLDPGNPASQMCLTCHSQKTGFETKDVGKHSHPVNVKPLSNEVIQKELPLFLEDATRDPVGSVQCFTCHNVHQWDPNRPDKKGGKDIEGDARNSFLRISNDQSSALCVTCHADKKQVLNSDHNLKVTAPEEKNVQGFTAGISGPCGACHVPHNAAGKKLWARRLDSGAPAPQMCLTCHRQKTGFETKDVGKHSHPVNVKPVSKEAIPGELPLFLADATRDPAGRVQCFTCHNVHQWEPKTPANNGGKNPEGDATNSFLRISNDQSSALCVTCHADKKQIISSDHNLKVTAPEEKNIQGLTAGISGPCSACHIPHNAAGKKLWAKPLSGGRDWASRSCAGCHSETGAAKTKLIGDYSHPVDVGFKSLNTTVTGKQVHAKLPLYGSDGDKKPDGNIVCVTCHDPHTWAPKKVKPISNDTFQNMEGDAFNSFLRETNSPSPNLCKTCHLAEIQIYGTDHDLSVTAPQATNLLGQTVKVSGVCGTCHLVHNSPNKLKIWARPYGPVSENENIIAALCKSCHSKGNLAEKKIPEIDTHPLGKLINSTKQDDTKQKGFTPVYDPKGNETDVGDIACPSCHNAHRWSPISEEKEGWKNSGQNTMDKYKFLRNLSYRTVCMDCHGPEGLLRYLYFHDPDKRPRG